MNNLTVEPLKKALNTLTSALTSTPSELERDGLIQRFEYTLELSWKISKKVLFENGVEAESPKAIFREMAQLGWINEPEMWFGFLKARNKTNHIYHKEVAEEIFSEIPRFIE